MARICGTCGQYGHRMRYCIRNQPAPHAHVVAAPVAPLAPSAPAFSSPPTCGNGYNITTGAYDYGGGDGPYGGGAYGYGYGDGSYGGGAMVVAMVATAMAPTAVVPTITADTAVPVGQSPGGGDAGHDIPSRPPVAPDGGCHRAMQQAGNEGDGVAFVAEDGGYEDEGYLGGPFSSVFGGPEWGHGPTAYALQLPTSGCRGGTGCDIPRSPPQYNRSNNGYGTNGGPQQQHAPRPCSFGWEQRGACRNRPPVNGLANSIAQGQAQRDVEVDCHDWPVSQVSGHPETTASSARGDPPLQACRQRRLQPPRGTLSPPTAVILDLAFEEWLHLNEMEMPMFSLSKGQRQQPPNSAASVGGAPASSAVAAASAEIPVAEPATSGTVPSTASIREAVDARESSAGAVLSEAAAEVATSTGGTAAPVASAARAARALASTAGSAGDSWAWAISQGRLRFYPRRRVTVRRLPPRPRPIPTAQTFLPAQPAISRRRTRTRRRRGTRDFIARFGRQRRTRSLAVCARLAHSRSWGGHSNEINIISAKWVYSWKNDEFGNVVRAKTRLVARGFSQREGIDFSDTFSPCPSVISIRLVAARACELDLDLCHFDAGQAFVQSDLDEIVYNRLLSGCGALSGKVVKLRRSLYGLKQALRT